MYPLRNVNEIINRQNRITQFVENKSVAEMPLRKYDHIVWRDEAGNMISTIKEGKAVTSLKHV